MKMLVIVALVTLAALATAAQPCHEDNTCFKGHFCSEYRCSPCLSCQTLKREEPSLKSECVKYISDCGSCLKDLVERSSGDLTCVPRDEGDPPAADNSTSLLIAMGFVVVSFVVLAAVAIGYFVKNSNILKFRMDTNIDATLPHVMPTAPPVPPPPYSQLNGLDVHQPSEDLDSKHPLIKQYQPPFPEYESQDRQKGVVYNPPAYVRLPPELSLTPQLPGGNNDVNDNYAPPVVEDDNTRPSQWTAGTGTTTEPEVNGVSDSPQLENGASAGDFSAALAVARNTELIHPPSVAVRLQPLNNNEEPNGASGDEAHAHYSTHGGAGGGGGAGGASTRTQGNGNYNVMNVNQIITIIKPPH